MDLVLEAAAFAISRHHGQVRGAGDNTIPYATHCMDVCRIVSRYGWGSTVKCAAILHDILEDTPTKESELELAFGGTVLNYVKELTLPPDLTVAPVGADRRQLKLAYQIGKMTDTTDAVRIIKIADKMSNCSDLERYPPSWPVKYQLNYVEDAEAVVLAAFKHAGEPPLLKEVYDTALRVIERTSRVLRSRLSRD